MTGLSFLREPPVGRIVLDRTERRNAMSEAMWAGLPALVAQAETDTDIKVVVLTGAGGHFCAGADISQFPSVHASEASSRAYGAFVRAANEALANCAKPVIAAIRGTCFGGGCGLALCADIRFAGQGATFAITPAKLGLVYPFGDVRRLADAVGLSRAKDILFSARTLTAQEALSAGLIDFLCAEDELDATVAAYAAGLAELSQYSIRALKKSLHHIRDGAVEESEDIARSALGAYGAEDFREGVRAFLEERPPRFTFR